VVDCSSIQIKYTNQKNDGYLLKNFFIEPQKYFLLRNIPSLDYLYSCNFVCYKTCYAQSILKCAKTDQE